MFALWQQVEKNLEGQEDVAIGFLDLEITCNAIPRELAMTTLRWTGVLETEVGTVEGTHEDTKSSRVSRGPGMSGEFTVNVDLGQGSVLSPLTGMHDATIRGGDLLLLSRTTALPFVMFTI